MTTPTTTERQMPHAEPAAPTAESARASAERTLTLPRLIDWLQTELLAFPRLGTSEHQHVMRSEQYTDGGRLVLRVELPGIDASEDLDVSVAGDVLTVRAERHAGHKDDHHSEFFYGKLVRTFLLPRGIDENAVTATYRDGILEISVPLREYNQQKGRTVPVTRAAG